MEPQLERISRQISQVLRHQPEKIGIALDPHGWASVKQLIEGINRVHHSGLTMEMLEEIVANNNKKRFSFDQYKQRIRANQGHSERLHVDVELPRATPPQVLYHGTAWKLADVILREGLKPMTRQHVHLSADVRTAAIVGKRHGNPVVFEVRAGELAEAGQEFFLSVNGVWLTGPVEPRYLHLPTPPFEEETI